MNLPFPSAIAAISNVTMPLFKNRWVAWCGCFVASVVCATSPTLARDSVLDFNRDVRPILGDACFHCHGPDPEHREAGLRLDRWTSDGDDMAAEDVIVPGDGESSEFVYRVSTDDPDLQMPPVDSGKQLTPEQKKVLERWVAEGAKYAEHWAFVVPQRPAVPPVERQTWVRNPIDAFVLANLESEGLSPSPDTDYGTLLRRLYIDTLGLPPTDSELESRSQLQNEAGYQAVIDRLLASPHFGERWARLWLDAASYADSNGFEKDRPREMWMYRDWVVDAINRDKPYDEFVIEQVAGDLLPKADQASHVATGFFRNTMVNEEGGIDPEQFRMEALFARIDTLGKSVLGLTLQCAQCHTHKYDPISHEEYYRLLAFLNNCYESNATVYPADEMVVRQRILDDTQHIVERMQASRPRWRDEMQQWATHAAAKMVDWQVVRPELDGSGGQKHYLLPDGSVLAQGYAPSQVTTKFTVQPGKAQQVTAVRLELLTHPTLPYRGPGRSTEGLCALTEFKVEVQQGSSPAESKTIAIRRATCDWDQPTRPLAARFDDGSGKQRTTGSVRFAIDQDETTAWGIDRGPGRRNTSRTAVFVLAEPLQVDANTRLTFHLVQMHGESYHEDVYNNSLGRFRFSVTDAPDIPSATFAPRVREAITKGPSEWSEQDEVALFDNWRQQVDTWRDENRQIDALWGQHPHGVSQLVLEEREEPRITHLLKRGDFLKPGEAVSAGVPQALHTLSATDPNRLDFAQWLVDRQSPTTARVIVNRIWQAYFGVGLVETAEDFGVQGTPPSHPKLLDWLAVELMEHDWSLKHIHRLILQSSTYRQSSVATPELLQLDPHNRLLARGSRYRVDAEIIRDVALAAAGLLQRDVGGPSVYPPAPEFLFKPPVSYTVKPWPMDAEPQPYRRAIYTFRYRSLPYPTYQTFDAPTGELACARRIRSNTPTQALVSLNEPVFNACAQALADAAIDAIPADSTGRIEFMFERCLSRRPRPEETRIVASFVQQQLKRLEHGELDSALLSGSDDPSHARELAAWTAAARVVLNLDEAISRQ